MREYEFVEYFLFSDILEELLEKVNEFLERFQKDYICHKDVIKSIVRTKSSEVLLEDGTEE